MHEDHRSELAELRRLQTMKDYVVLPEDVKFYVEYNGQRFDLQAEPSEEFFKAFGEHQGGVQVRGILRALRWIIMYPGGGEGASVIFAATNLRRRYDQLVKKYGEIS